VIDRGLDPERTPAAAPSIGPTAIGPPEMVLVRYSEIALKGNNRIEFERALIRNLRAATSSIAKLDVKRRRGRLALYPDRRAARVAERASQVFGVASASPAWTAPLDPNEIAAVAHGVLADALASAPAGRTIRFRVRTRRAEKRFPLTSGELDRFVADRVLDPEGPLVVDLSNPELTLGIDVRSEGAYVFARSVPGPGGLPVGTLGRGLCLLSGGIDSPVAAWSIMKRGTAMSFVTFHSYPYIGEASKKKVVDLVRRLARWQPESHVLVAPFTRIQETIRDGAPPGYRTILYRRMMHRIASRLARDEGAGVLVTGECLGQVASQTMENLTCIGAAAELPVLRPLISFDKQETIALARRIGTFETSILPEPDCCTVFQPKRPVLRGRLSECEAAEAGFDVDGLVAEAVRQTERIDVEPD